MSRLDDDGCGCVVLIVAPIVFGVVGYWFGRGGRAHRRTKAGGRSRSRPLHG